MLTNLKKVRMQKKFSQKRISEMIGISESYYCQLETGVRRMSLPIARKIAVVLGQSMDDLFMSVNFADCREDRSAMNDRGNSGAR
ncbi:anaerobic benzoate catabolism transcriptional regulator [Sporotomaculum syntrophicum]|uniref:Anaerobic benzoate catabolism transcriptional regulator n=1 Tax=Sporotomaculum syntrophicum TaxID=182264 RepID=A0A9D2WRL0_9FIRM|nr:helix-turn-helix transcriptional regulator [Sporotomaculum syntrophicum]KAF1086154.1 anaerobic benzoate catabolism transcriptional regulator [Sporotomaculum syntrophicum]